MSATPETGAAGTQNKNLATVGWTLDSSRDNRNITDGNRNRNSRDITSIRKNANSLMEMPDEVWTPTHFCGNPRKTRQNGKKFAKKIIKIVFVLSDRFQSVR
jgi:hypothetical protein